MDDGPPQFAASLGLLPHFGQKRRNAGDIGLERAHIIRRQALQIVDAVFGGGDGRR